MTLVLNKNTTNIIGVTASEKKTVESFYFLFRFQNVETLEETTLQIEADETNGRWDRFTIVMPDDVNLRSGFYHYYVYQSEVDGSTDFENMVELENGKLIVPATAINEKTFNENGEDKVFDFE